MNSSNEAMIANKSMIIINFLLVQIFIRFILNIHPPIAPNGKNAFLKKKDKCIIYVLGKITCKLDDG